MTRPLTEELAAWAAGLTLAQTPADVIERVTLVFADITGIMVRARQESESTPALLATLAALGLSGGPFRAIGDDAGYSASGAALLNGANAHSLEMDDTYSPRGSHTASCVVPAALAAAQLAGASGADLLAGLVAGHEVMCRVGLGMGGRSRRGFHMTPITGSFGATAAAGRILGLTAAELTHAFGIVLSQTAGTHQFHVNGAWTKRFQIGNAAASGLLAATLARQGYSGAAQALEGAQGFYRLYADEPQPELAVAGLGQTWEILQLAFKPHASCRGTHAAIDAAIALRDAHGIAFDQIERVDIGLPRRPYDLIDLLASPIKLDPQNVVDGQFSITFTVATALRLGRLGWDDYDTQLWDPAIRDLMARSTVFEDAAAEAMHAGSAAGSVRVHLRDGASHHALVTVPKGEPENMVTRAELRVKFDALVTPYLGDAGAEALYHTLTNIEREPTVEAVFRHATPTLTPARAGAAASG